MTTSVVIITLNRSDCVRMCLEHLTAQTRQPDEIIVVDASPDDRTSEVVAKYAGVIYVRNSEGAGRMTTSRNIALRRCRGDIIAFLDDDAYAHPQWLAELLSTYETTDAGAVGGRACNNVPGEESYRVAELGRLKPNGELTGYFGGDPGCVIEVDHVMGCNMSFRREVLAQLGGFREDYPGISGVCEDSDMCMRVRAIGFRILFNPRAAVDHIGAPQETGRRFDWRYALYGQRNHFVLLIRNFGLSSILPWRYLLHSVWRDAKGFVRRLLAGPTEWWDAITIVLATSAGTVSGVASGVGKLLAQGRNPMRPASGLLVPQSLTSAMSKSPF